MLKCVWPELAVSIQFVYIALLSTNHNLHGETAVRHCDGHMKCNTEFYIDLESDIIQSINLKGLPG